MVQGNVTLVEEKIERFKCAMDVKLSDYALQSQISSLEQLMTEYVHITDLQRIEQKVDPVYAECKETLSRCLRSNSDMREAIVQLDGAISSKAERFNLEQLKKWCVDTFLPVVFIAKTEKEMAD